MNNFCLGSGPQNNPQSPFGSLHPQQQRSQAGMGSMGNSAHPQFGTTSSIQQQNHSQFMMNRQPHQGEKAYFGRHTLPTSQEDTALSFIDNNMNPIIKGKLP